MNKNTGKIYNDLILAHEYKKQGERFLKSKLAEDAEFEEIKEEDVIPINEEDMTDKQRENMQVSKYDNISKLGKLFTGSRKERREQAKQFKKQLQSEKKHD